MFFPESFLTEFNSVKQSKLLMLNAISVNQALYIAPRSTLFFKNRINLCLTSEKWQP